MPFVTGTANDDVIAEFAQSPGVINRVSSWSDTIDGGGGNDTIEAASGADSVHGGEGDDRISGYDGNDTLIGGNGNDTVSGDREFDAGVLAGNDLLFGGDGNDLIYGGPGSDTMLGGAGDDTMFSDQSPDHFIGGDYISANQGFDVVSYFNPLGAPLLVAVNAYLHDFTWNAGGATGDTYGGIRGLIGSTEGDVLGAAFVGSYLNGEAGNDTLIAGVGADTILGGAGFDLVAYNGTYYASTGVHASLANAALNTGEAAGDTYSGVEGIGGSAGNDTLVGDGNAVQGNHLLGLDGNDLLEGGSGADFLHGGSGFDTASYFDAGPVVVNLASGLATDGYGFQDTLVSIEAVNGSNAGDVILGDGNANLLRGLGGPDTVDGGAGADTVEAGAGDSLAGGEGIDTLVIVGGSAYINQEGFQFSVDGIDLAGLSGFERIIGTDGNDLLVALTGGGTLEGGAGADVLYNAAGPDSLSGGADGDVLYLIGTDGDTVDGGAGDDRLALYLDQATTAVRFTMAAGDAAWLVRIGGVTQAAIRDVEALTAIGGTRGDQFDARQATVASSLDGAGGADTLRGGRADDQLTGGAGNDQLFGHAGNDLLVGGAGRDMMTGGTGADIFRWDLAAEGNDSIADFASGQDRLQIDASGFRGGLVEGMDLAATGRFVEGTVATQAGGQFLYDIGSGVLAWDRDGTGDATAVTIATLTPGSVLAASDFVIVA